MTPVEFGARLIESGDLDPVYIAAAGAGFSRPRLSRFLVAYWCVYDAGTAHVISGEREFYDALRAHVDRPGSRRGVERRHFRGPRAVAAVDFLRDARVEANIEELFTVPPGKPAEQLVRIAQYWPQFGPWISFKVADMIDRLVVPLDWSRFRLDLYREPTIGALWWKADLLDTPREEYAELLVGNPGARRADVAWALARLRNELGHLRAPPSGDRPVGLPEFETILCKWKSHETGHYPLGKDTREVLDSLWERGGPDAGAAYHALAAEATT